MVKVWSSRTGQLIATLRGHSAEITDISISDDNSMIATGSLDKSVRVWCGHSTAPLAVLCSHAGHITSVQVAACLFLFLYIQYVFLSSSINMSVYLYITCLFVSSQISPSINEECR